MRRSPSGRSADPLLPQRLQAPLMPYRIATLRRWSALGAWQRKERATRQLPPCVLSPSCLRLRKKLFSCKRPCSDYTAFPVTSSVCQRRRGG